MRILGAHPAASAGERGVIIRALAANAARVECVLDDGRAVPLDRDAEGLSDLYSVFSARCDAAVVVSLSLHYVGRHHLGARRSLSLSSHARRRRSASVQRRHAPAALEEARRASARDRRRRGRQLRGLGAERAARERRRRFLQLGRPRVPDAHARRARACGSCSFPAIEPGALYKFEMLTREGAIRLKTDPFAAKMEQAPGTASIVAVRGLVCVGRRRRGSTRARAADHVRAPMSIYEVHLGSWARVPEDGNRVADVSRDRAAARRAREAARLHARRAAAGDGASVLRLVGIPGQRLLRADVALRHAGRFPLLRRHAAPARHRRDARLGAGALSRRTTTRCAASTARRCTSTRIRGSASIPTGAR